LFSIQGWNGVSPVAGGRPSPPQPVPLPVWHKITQGIPGGADLPRAGLGLFRLPDFFSSWFVSLAFIWETGQEASSIFFFLHGVCNSESCTCSRSLGAVLKQGSLFSLCLQAAQHPLPTGAGSQMIWALCDDGQQPPGWHSPAVGAEKPRMPPFLMWDLQTKIASIFCFLLRCTAWSLVTGSSVGEIRLLLVPVGA